MTDAPVTIQRVENDRDLHAFIAFQWEVYRNDPYWVPPLYFERREFLDRKKSAFFKHAEADYFLARRGTRIVGTIAAFVNHRHNEFQNEKTGFFGFFEVLEDFEAAQALLDTAREWVKARGMDVLRGPAQFSTNEECGLLVDGFDSPPVIMMTYNPRYYVDFIERAGFHKAHDLYAYAHTKERAGENVLPAKLRRVVEKVKARGEFTVRRANLSRLNEEIKWVKRLYNSAWEKNWGFVPMDEAEFDHMADGLKPILDPALLIVIERAGEPVGFGLTLPDVNYYLHKVRPGPSLLGSYIGIALVLLRLKLKPPPGMRVFVLGVLEEYRAQGVDALLYYETISSGLQRGYTWAEGGWVVESNLMMNRAVQFFGAERYKTYRFYEKPVG